MRRFRPSVSPLEPRNLLTTVLSPWAPGPPLAASATQTSLTVTGYGMAFFQGSGRGDRVTVSDLPSGGVLIQVDNDLGTDAYPVPAGFVLESTLGGGANDYASTASDTEIVIGGTGSNTVRGGSGFVFEVSTGGGDNTFFAGSGYSVFVASSTGTTTMFGGGVFNSASLCNGTDTLNQGAGVATVVYTYGNSLDTINAAPVGALDVYIVGSFDPTVNDNGNPAVTVHRGFN